MVKVITKFKGRKSIVQNVKTVAEANKIKKFVGKSGTVEIIPLRRKVKKKRSNSAVENLVRNFK